MLPKVKTQVKKLERYKNLTSRKLFKEIKSLAKELEGLKVVHINATPQGGGVAEILRSLVPLMKGVRLKAQWYVLPFEGKFFKMTKEFHNALQGKKFSLSSSSKNLYIYYMRKLAKMMKDIKADIWVIHDPQPVGVIQFLERDKFPLLISRIHIDTSTPDFEAWDFIKKFLLEYNKIIFSALEFTHQDIPKKKRVIFPPAIDPLTEKNKLLSLSSSKKILKRFGINPKKPLISQISRFDPWKDPEGVIMVYKKAKKKIPDLQLALVGLFLAQDDPEAITVFKKVKKAAEKDKDIFLFSDPKQLKNLNPDRFVNAFQTASDVILQKSTREGFALTVTEAMWKGKVVVGGNVGGIKLQIKNGENGFLVSNIEEAAERVIEVIKNQNLRKKLGKLARKTVKEKFLIPRLLRDYLKLFRELI